jgi:hypothetical protein
MLAFLVLVVAQRKTFVAPQLEPFKGGKGDISASFFFVF